MAHSKHDNLPLLVFFAATFDFSQSSFRDKGIQTWKHLDGEVSEPVLAEPTGEFRSRRSLERPLALKNRLGARKMIEATGRLDQTLISR